MQDEEVPEILLQLPNNANNANNANAQNIRVVPVDNHFVKLSITTFTGDPSTLHEFLSEYYQLSDAYGMREEQKIR